ncbi:ankyrin repeat domain-containing protein [Paenibacillus lignilyticus]|uniref:Ankyrin repeat domain-containing protein n=1 Tax=Paenibacillus lignilyticus TaxID=1172615 RepID=A0ABS5CLH2_9BACL|nr:ankyrin repeat domain-containing protein [Paenibacillus lignilyticus]MBP3966670.1 ankyrin repeat domain-containing protein [Paenibacillus lignilyticus]
MTELNHNSNRSAGEPDSMAILQFKQAVEGNNSETVRQLLHDHPSLVKRIDEPWFSFDAPAIVISAGRGRREMVDALLEYGADINVKSSWWAGGFGVLHHDHHDLSRYLIERGAHVDPHAAAALGMLDHLKTMVEKEPEIVNQRGPDGQVPLHFAVSSEVMDFLLNHGAEIDKRDLDHDGTPAQYAVNNPDKCRHLIERGAKADLFMACKLGDAELVREILNDDPHALQAQVGKGDLTAAGGHIYEYTVGSGAKPLFLADRLGLEAITDLMLSYCSVEQKFLLACMRADTATVHDMVRERIDIVQTLKPEDQSVIADAAWDGKTDAVRLMLEVGFNVDARRNERSMTALHGAAVQGNDEVVRLLIDQGASVDMLNEFGGTPLNSCIWGSLHMQNPEGDYGLAAEILIEAGVKLPDQAMGSEKMKDVLIRHGVPGENG